ncbi:NUDIX hydrolase [Microbacterium flavum]|uniref:NUDIX hydrolase n=1 Tax=Microbacterium flavum TaxID=415216 RepID=A0ABS5XT95_9MICO|nr:NUDIX hydrolase [Microbacterium flavum]MBT8797753.1 NUDIX hydrolase [Microbacterium flavum]
MDLRVAAYAVIFDERRGGLLLAHWHEARRGAWTLPGGGLEPGEDPEDAVRREVQEETGYRAEVDELLGIHSRVIPARQRLRGDGKTPLHTLRIVYRAHIVAGDLTDEQDGSTDRAAWFPRPQVETLHRVTLVDVALEMADRHTAA